MKNDMTGDKNERLVDLMEKSLAIQLHSMGVPQAQIAIMLNKSKTWVNMFLKPIADRERS
ncbi:MAG: hypothetical protein O7A06_08830 [Acidobacteria bacterium]|nr:hypothetical protein [Acidobacteriota bacterium]MCZ6750765.1 hypothetical protein [Acidobacteriota bacterium]